MPRATLSELAKAVIFVLDERGNPEYPIPVFFNPTEYNVDTSTNYSEQALLGMDSPLVQFVSGETETLSMQLFVDSYELGTDVRIVYTNHIDRLLKVDGKRHAPPQCTFVWGSLVFKSVLVSANKRFTMFLPGGFPVRAEIDVTFRRYQTPTEQLVRVKRESADKTTVRSVEAGETLTSIAAAEYGDPETWRPIAEANGIDDPRTLEPGRELVIPPLED
ncbi:CIS tube protein [Halogeometricum limi]|uniref:LysM domain-containing protein n=1 Tax=Halogeometricum limi TaxID=555875 RepID=A0A1I6IEM4_9EURY|nr:LysM peptidoglycan-binding domain-containing protein [Halogeometricum limi]SFR65148.1 LysM domain-containing protein [Halogeometricum limi]